MNDRATFYRNQLRNCQQLDALNSTYCTFLDEIEDIEDDIFDRVTAAYEAVKERIIGH